MKTPQNQYMVIAIMYIAFFALIGFAIHLTGSATPLWALILIPSYSHSDGDKTHICPKCSHIFKDDEDEDEDD